jgi:hypothetical protein
MKFLKRLFAAADVPKPTLELPWPHDVVRGADAVKHLQTLRDVGRSAGFSPVLLGDTVTLGELTRGFERGATTGDVLGAATELDAADVFAKRRHALGARYSKPGENVDAAGQRHLAELVGEWPKQPPKPIGLSAHLAAATSRPHAWIVIAHLPTSACYEIPAFLHLGGWADCPPAADMVAVFRAWHARYGADIVCATDDTIECIVARPPRTPREAEQLAVEHYLFCDDLVVPEVETTTEYAATLVDAPVWRFWWDS